MKNKRKKFILILFIILIMSLGFTYAFFTYNGVSDSSNTLVAGDIYMNLADVSNSITLTNQYPMTPEEARSRSDNYIDFIVSGKNTSNKNIYYEIGLQYADDIVGKNRLFDYDLAFDLYDITNGEFIVKEGNYQDLENAILYVDTIGTTDSYSRNFRLRMWINDSVIISDTEINAHYKASSSGPTESILYSNTYANVKVKVYGDMKEKNTLSVLYDILDDKAVMDNVSSTYVSSSTGIDFTDDPSDTNGKGIYTLSSTSSDEYPVKYFRGNVEDNNIIFGGYCWQIVRTTETGGIKMVYNGKPGISVTKGKELTDNSLVDELSYDSNRGGFYKASGSTALADDNNPYGFNFSLPEEGYYTMEFITNGIIGFGLGDMMTGNMYGIHVNDGGSNANSTMSFKYNEGDSVTLAFLIFDANSNILIKIYQGDQEYDKKVCLNDMLGYSNSISVGEYGGSNSNSMNEFDGVDTDSNFNSWMNDQFYMYGDESSGRLYKNNESSSYYYSDSIGVENKKYKLNGSLSSSCSITNRYTLFHSVNDNSNVGYAVFNNISTGRYYFKLKNGDSESDNYRRMTENIHDSKTKSLIDSWYKNNLFEYTDYLEDTVWCNDRSYFYETTEGNYFVAKGITQSNLENNIIDLSCPNINDSFTVSKKNGNGALTYPIALLTAPETYLAGIISVVFSMNKMNYLKSLFGDLSTMSMSFDDYGSGSYMLSGVSNTYSNSILRPSVSLKHDILIRSGDGSFDNPYVVN